MFEYNDFKDKGITSKIKNVRWKKIIVEEFDPDSDNAEHRPIREAHINKIVSSYNGVDVPITVIWNSKTKKYHVVDGQHRWFAIKKLISMGVKKQPKRYPCLVLYYADTDEKLDINNAKDVKLSNEVSFCANEGSERTCIIDKIYQVWKIGKQYMLDNGYKSKLKTGKGKLPYGIVKYISKKWMGYEKLSSNVITNYLSYGGRIYRHNLWNKALTERWVESRIIEELDIAEGNMKKKTYPITIRVSDKALLENEGVVKLKNNYLYWDTHFQKIASASA